MSKSSFEKWKEKTFREISQQVGHKITELDCVTYDYLTFADIFDAGRKDALRWAPRQKVTGLHKEKSKMPVIMCEWCEYLGQGDTYEDRIADVEKHEETCPEKLAQQKG